MSRNKKIILIDGVMLLIVIFAVTFFVILKPDYKKVVSNTTSMESVSIVKVRNEITVPYGSDLPVLSDFIKYGKKSGKLEIYFDNELVKDTKLNSIGCYKAVIIIDNERYESVINVVDTVAPILDTNNITIKLKETYSINDFVKNCTDNVDENCIIEYAAVEMAGYNAVGTYDIDIIAKDSADNETKSQVKLTIEGPNQDETIEPVIKTKYGVKITTTIINGETKIEYDRSGYEASTDDLLEEANNLLSMNKKQISDIVKYTNEYRKLNDLAELELDPSLSKAAMVRALEIAYAKNLSHERPNGKNWNTVLSDFNIKSNQNSENIAAMQYSAKMAMDWWKNSASHNANILNKKYKKTGVGYVYIPVDHKYYWVQIFSE